MKKITKKTNIKVSIIITFVTMLVSVILHFFYTPFLLKQVGDDQYGLYGFVNSTLSWLTVAIGAILSAYNKFASESIAKDKNHGEESINSIYSFMVIVWSGIIALLASSIVILIYTKVIVFKTYDEADQKTLSILFVIISIQIVFTIATKVSNLNITFNNHHIWIKMSTLLTTTLAPLLSIPFILQGHGIITIVIIIAIINVSSSILDVLFDRYILKKKYKLFPTREQIKEIWPIIGFCSIVFINEIAYQIDCNVDNFVLGLKGYSSQITIYSLALSIVTIASTCSSMIYSPFIPTVFNNEANNNREANLKLYNIMSFAQLMLWMFVAGGFISCGYPFVQMWVGKERIVVYFICSTLFIIRSLNNAAGPSKDMMRAAGKHKQRAILAVIATTINSISTVLLVTFLPEKLAIWGCVIGTGASSIICWWIIANIMSYKYLKIDVKHFYLNALIIFAITAASCSGPIILYKTIFDGKLMNVISFILCGVIFVTIFSFLSLFIFKKKIVEIYHLLRRKSE